MDQWDQLILTRGTVPKDLVSHSILPIYLKIETRAYWVLDI